MNRGASRRSIFAHDEQRLYFLDLLGQASERFDADWHAYCLMGNHYHLMLRTPEGNLQRIMRHVNGVYTQYYNRTLGRDGPLFRGRYKAVLVDAETYWIQLSRYIHRNPLEAGIVNKLARYPWSSYPAYIGAAKRADWLSCSYILGALARRNAKARYRAYVESSIEDDVSAFYAKRQHGSILGDDAFRNRLQLKRRKSVDIPELRAARPRPKAAAIIRAVAEHFGVARGEIRTMKRGPRAANSARGAAMYLCQDMADMKLAEIASLFGLASYASASSGIRNFKARMEEDRKLQRTVKSIKLDLTP